LNLLNFKRRPTRESPERGFSQLTDRANHNFNIAYS
jgi:hypothetical protein